MNCAVASPQIGQWYERADTGALFQVTGLDEGAGTIEIQSFDGDVDEIETQIWGGLPLAMAQPPEDWLAAADLDAQDLGCARAAALLENPRALEQIP